MCKPSTSFKAKTKAATTVFSNMRHVANTGKGHQEAYVAAQILPDKLILQSLMLLWLTIAG